MTVMGVITSEDIFMKAAMEYCRRLGCDPHGLYGDGYMYCTNADKFRNDLADLAERINSLKTVGAI